MVVMAMRADEHPARVLTGCSTVSSGCARGRVRGGCAGAGFTLIELLVVIAIVAVLVGILLPTLAGARASARGAVCLSNLRGAFTAVRAYADEFKGLSPAIGQPYTTTPNWAIVVQNTAGRTGTTADQTLTGTSVLVCPSARAAYGRMMNRTYAINGTGYGGKPGDRGNYDDAATTAHIRMDQIAVPSAELCLMDSAAAATVSDGPPPTRTASVVDFRDPVHVRERLGRWHGSPATYQAAMFDGSARLVPEPRE